MLSDQCKLLSKSHIETLPTYYPEYFMPLLSPLKKLLE